MLRFSDIYHNRDVLSLRVGAVIGHVYAPILNPNNLKIEGWYATENGSRDERILPVAEIRDVIKTGLVVNDHDALTLVDDLVRLKEIIALRFELIGKAVKTDQKRKLGKISDYAVDDQSLVVQKLYVSPGAMRGLTKQDLIIDRSQIVEINNKHVIVQDSTIRAASGAPSPVTA
jgi:uncharacterized protein YrrD